MAMFNWVRPAWSGPRRPTKAKFAWPLLLQEIRSPGGNYRHKFGMADQPSQQNSETFALSLTDVLSPRTKCCMGWLWKRLVLEDCLIDQTR